MPPVTLIWSFDLGSSPRDLWPLISDTNRMNRLAGMGPVVFRDGVAVNGERRREGQSAMLGLTMRWEERPFAWSAGENLGVERRFFNGPLRAYRSTVTLVAVGQGTRLEHRVEFVPRWALVRPFLRLLNFPIGAGWAKAYRAVDAFLLGKSGDPFLPHGPATRPASVAAMERRLQQAGWPGDLIAKLVDLVLAGDDLEVQQIRPFALADRWREPRLPVLSLCLEAAHIGLLSLRWSVLCPHCRGPKASVSRLGDLATSARCFSCEVDVAGRFDESIELAFRPAPRVRNVTETLYCEGGPGATPHIAFQGTLAPGERLELAMTVEPGTYRLRGKNLAGPATLLYEGEYGAAGARAEVGVGPDGIRMPGQPIAGKVLALAIHNEAPTTLALVLEQTSWRLDVVTAAFVTCMPEFRRMFPTEAPGETLSMPIALMTFLAYRVPDAAALSRQWGDDDGNRLVADLLAAAVEAVAEHGGVAYKTLGDIMIASFFDPLDGVTAALTIQDRLAESPLKSFGPLVAIGIDAGACQAKKGIGGLDYEGRPVGRALEAARLAPFGAIGLSADVAEEIAVRMLLGARGELRQMPLAAPGEDAGTASYVCVCPPREGDEGETQRLV